MAKMNRDTTRRRDESDWDYSKAVHGGPAKNPRAVVSVSLRASDFRDIAQHAQQLGMRTSEFIREAALRAIAPDSHRPTVWPPSAGVVSWTFQVDALVDMGSRAGAERATPVKTAA